MPSNVIVFDAEYIMELASNMNVACMLVNEAVKFLKRASLHEGWKCKECVKISDNLDDLNIRLGRLDEGVNETTRILGGSIDRFADLEARYETQAESLSDDLRNNYGFKASGYTGSSSGGGTVGGFAGGTAGAAGLSGSGGGSASSSQPSGQPGTSGSRVRMASMRMPGAMGQAEPGSVLTGEMPHSTTHNGGTMNLPVTHIPDKPEAMAKGIKAAQEIEDIAVVSVTESIIGIVGGDVDIIAAPPEVREAAIRNIVQVYNAGKSVAESSAAIIADPSLPHTEERIAMASGLVTLAGGAAASAAMMGGSVLAGAGAAIGSVPEAVRSDTQGNIAGTSGGNAELISGVVGDVPSGNIQGNASIPVDGSIPSGNTQGMPANSQSSPSVNASPEISGGNTELISGVVAHDVPSENIQASPASNPQSWRPSSNNNSSGKGFLFNASNLATNAEEILKNMTANESDEVKQILQAFTSGSSGSGASGNPFLEVIKKAISGKMQEEVLSLGFLGSVSMQDFIGRVS